MKESPPGISVALCTCNGEKFLPDQLESYLRQTLLPDELVACDDASDDDTYSLMKRFSEKAPFPVKLFRNKTRLGPAQNFEQTISLCGGNFIILSDQDDRWLPNRVAVLREAYRENPMLGLVFSDALILDSSQTFWDRSFFGPDKRKLFREDPASRISVLLRSNIVMGASLALAGWIREKVFPVPAGWLHDEWIAFAACAQNIESRMLDVPLLEYRLHPAQFRGNWKAPGIRERWNELKNGRALDYFSEVDRWNEACDRLSAKSDTTTIGLIRQRARHGAMRAGLSRLSFVNRAQSVISASRSGEYGRFGNGWKSALYDVMNPPVAVMKAGFIL